MMTWLSLWALSSSWLFLSGIFGTHLSKWGYSLFLLGIVFGLLRLHLKLRSEWSRALSRLIPKTLFLLLLVPPILIFPFPYKLGPILLFAGILLPRLLLPGIIMCVQGMVLLLYLVIGSRFHDLSIVTPLISGCLKLFGITCSLDKGIIYIPTHGEFFAFPTTLEHIGLLPMSLIILGGVIVLLAYGKRRRLFFFVVATLCYSMLRYIYVVVSCLSLRGTHFFWDPGITSVSFVPLFLFCVIWIRLGEPSKIRTNSTPFFQADYRYAYLFASILFIAGFLMFQDPGTKKSGQVLIDEGHSDWEWTTEIMDTEWYGVKSVYNYWCFSKYLGHYYKVASTTRNLTPRLLNGCDVLILKPPTKPFSDNEIEAVKDFVRKGGGLLLIAEHTNIFGSSVYLNAVAKQFGFRFMYDATYDLISGKLALYSIPRALPHPAVSYMNSPFLFATSCSMTGSLFSENVMIGSSLKAIRADYSQTNFFPAKKEHKDYRFGVFLLAAARKYGKGRIMTFTDSTIFSNFFMFMTGKPELIIGMIEWLNRKNRYHWVVWVFLIAGVSLLGLFIRSSLAKSFSLTGVLIVILLAISVSAKLFGALNKSFYPLPRPHTRYREVCFDMEHSGIFLPTLRLSEKGDRSFNTFYVWTQRIGLTPCVKSSLKESLSGDAVVIIEPQHAFTDEEIEMIRGYLTDGGNLLLMESSVNKESTANQLLGHFDMKVGDTQRIATSICDSSGNVICIARDALHIEGGKPMLWLDGGAVALSTQDVGMGKLFVFGSSSIFSNRVMGSTYVIPDRERDRINNLEFSLFRKMLGIL